MESAIITCPSFDAVWPFAGDYAHRVWSQQGPVEFVRTTAKDFRPVSTLLKSPEKTERLMLLGVPITPVCLQRLTALRELAWSGDGYAYDVSEHTALLEAVAARGVRMIRHTTEGFWGQSVAEFGLALTLCGLRRIPQLHRAMIKDPRVWDYCPPGGVGIPGARGQQFGDTSQFASGTLEGKRVRIVGVGNIGSRYASFCRALGADVAAWDPYASEPCFHRSEARREHFLDRLVGDAEIFAPMVPLSQRTRGLVTAAHIEALPRGALVVLVTRAGICDMVTLRRRVLAGELALAADVFDVEPLPPDDPLLGHPHVVHTPHNAGRTRQANERWAEMLLEQFSPV